MPIGPNAAPNDRYMQWARIWRKQVSLEKKWSFAGEKKFNHNMNSKERWRETDHQTARCRNSPPKHIEVKIQGAWVECKTNK